MVAPTTDQLLFPPIQSSTIIENVVLHRCFNRSMAMVMATETALYLADIPANVFKLLFKAIHRTHSDLDRFLIYVFIKAGPRRGTDNIN